MPAYFWIARSTSAAVATTGWTSRPVIVRMSSSAYTFAGSDIATSSLPSRSPIGMARYRRAKASGSSAVAVGSIGVFGEVDELEADLLGEGADEVGLLDHAHVDQDAADRLGRAAMLLERLVELLGRDHLQLDQDLAELFGLAFDRAHRRPCVRLLRGSIRSRSSGTCFVIRRVHLKQA